MRLNSILQWINKLPPPLGGSLGASPIGCVTSGTGVEAQLRAAGVRRGDANQFLIVDCLLPGQIRQLGSRMTYLSARRAVKTSASDRQIRGAEPSERGTGSPLRSDQIRRRPGSAVFLRSHQLERGNGGET